MARPVLDLGPAGAFDEMNVYFPSVLYDPEARDSRQRWKMWYIGTAANGIERLGYAYSADGRHWTKFGMVVDVGGPGEWDDLYLETGGAVRLGNTYYLFYGGNHVVAGRTQYGVGLVTFTSATGRYTKSARNPLIAARIDRSQLLVADLPADGRVVVVGSTRAFSAGEVVLLADTDSPPRVDWIERIDGPTTLTLRDAAGAELAVANGAYIRSLYQWSLSPKGIFRDDETWVLALTAFQQCRPEWESEYIGFATARSLTGPWKLDLGRGIALAPDPERSPWDTTSAENLTIVDVTDRTSLLPSTR